MQKKYTESIVGGTFDRLHKGHKKLLDAAFSVSDHVTIGVTTPALIEKKFLSSLIEDYSVREESVRNYLAEKEYTTRATFMPLEDIYGPSLEKEQIDAVFVTDATYTNAVLINKERKQKELPALTIEKIPFAYGADGEIITSERIRSGETNRDGESYLALFKQSLLMPESLRTTLQQPIGEIVSEMSEALSLFSPTHIFITIGDIVSASIVENGITPAMSVIDGKTRRHTLALALNHSSLENPAGTIQAEAVREYKRLLEQYLTENKAQTLSLAGEEDLIALPAILLAPLGAVVLYGQFDQGVVVNHVTEEMKEKVVQLIEQFSIYIN